MPPLTSDTGDTTHISLARMNHRGLEKQLFDEYYCLCHILQYNSWQQCCQFFLALEKLLRYSFVQRLNVIWPSQSGIWRHFLCDSFGWSVSDSFGNNCLADSRFTLPAEIDFSADVFTVYPSKMVSGTRGFLTLQWQWGGSLVCVLST